MPLLDIVGIISLNTSFYAGFCFLPNEQQYSYEFALQCLRGRFDQLNLQHPQTILVDKDDALINAIHVIFPFTNCMICIWHINKNILTKARPFLSKEIRDTADLDDKEFQDEIHKKW
jgi:hypothetical protein